MAITRKELLNQLMPELDKLFKMTYEEYSTRKVYEVIQREGDSFDVLEHSVAQPDDVLVAKGLTGKELDAMLNLLPQGSRVNKEK